MLLRPTTFRLVSPAFRLVVRRTYSSNSTAPLINIDNIPTPGTGHVRVLELNRPAARNAISKALLAALRTEVDAVHAQYTPEGDETASVPQNLGATRALIIASAFDESFCAGADLKERRTFTQEETAQFLADLRGTFSSIASLPIPTISAISSLALGGGLELALCTHFRVMASTAVVGLPETRIGIIPGAGGTFRLPALIGLPRARDLIVTGRRVSAPEAYMFGLADRLVEPTPEGMTETVTEESANEEPIPTRARRAALAESIKLAMTICEGGPIAIRAGIQAVNSAQEKIENAMYQRVVKSEDRDEALKAFGEKRKPVFTGR